MGRVSLNAMKTRPPPDHASGERIAPASPETQGVETRPLRGGVVTSEHLLVLDRGEVVAGDVLGASSTSAVRMGVAARRPRIGRERASGTDARYTVPDQVAT